MEQKLTGRLPGALEHMSSVSGETEITGVVWPGDEEREIPLLYTAAHWEGTEKTEPDSCQRCTVREITTDRRNTSNSHPSGYTGKLVVESSSLELSGTWLDKPWNILL